VRKDILMNPFGTGVTLSMKSLAGMCLTSSAATSLGTVDPACVRESDLWVRETIAVRTRAGAGVKAAGFAQGATRTDAYAEGVIKFLVTSIHTS